MFFRKANPGDAKFCLEIYDAISEWEVVNGKQACWEKGFYPTMDTVTDAISSNDLFVLEDMIDGILKIVACGIINFNQPKYYENFSWKVDAKKSEVLVLHTFGVNPIFQRKGYGERFMDFYENLARQNSCTCLRLDTVISNVKSQALYEKLGFKNCGQWEGDPNDVGWPLVFLGLEKKLESVI